MLLSSCFEAIDVLGRHQVQQGHAFDVLEGVVAEHLEVGAVGADVHALVHVGDRFARGLDQGVAAALGFADLGLEPALGATGFEVGPFAADRGQDLRRLVAQGQGANDAVEQFGEAVGVDLLDHRHQRDVLAARGDLLFHVLQRHGPARVARQDQVDRLAHQGRAQLVLVQRPHRSHGDAGVAQTADDAFRLLGTVIDQHQTQCGVLAFRHAGVSGGAKKGKGGGTDDATS